MAMTRSPVMRERKLGGARHLISRQFGLGGGEAGDRHAVGRARHVIEADIVAEADRGRVTAMFAANTELEAGPRLAPRSAAMRMSSPTPSVSSVTNGSCSKIPIF